MARFVQFTGAHSKKPILINTDLVRTAVEVEGVNNIVRLAMDADHKEEVQGTLHFVEEKLTNKWASTSQ
jgi:hypothetical protein